MRYILLSFFLLGLASCSFWNPPKEDRNKETIINSDTGGVQVSDSGTSVSNGSGNVLAGTGENTYGESGSGKVSVGNSGTISSSGGRATISGTGGVSTGTDNMEKDPEIQNITKDIDSIFSDIEKGGK